MRLSLPATVYSVSMVRLHSREAKHILSTEVFCVSGTDPLTSDEAIGRFDKLQAEKWSDAKYGPMADWFAQRHTMAVHSTVIGGPR